MSQSKSITKQKSNDNHSNITPEVATVIKELPSDKQKIILQALATSMHHSGPLPDGESIRVYSEVIPEGGDRLMKTVEKQLEHRINIENEGVKRTFNQSSTGQWMAFFIAIAFGLISWDLSKSGHELSAQILGTVDLVALVAVFITGKITSS